MSFYDVRKSSLFDAYHQIRQWMSFFDVRKIIVVWRTSPNQTVNQQFYIHILTKLQKNLLKKDQDCGVTFRFCSNNTHHRAKWSACFFCRERKETSSLEQIPCSPDHAHCQLFLLPNRKVHSKKPIFQSAAYIHEKVAGLLNAPSYNDFRTWFDAWKFVHGGVQIPIKITFEGNNT